MERDSINKKLTTSLVIIIALVALVGAYKYLSDKSPGFFSRQNDIIRPESNLSTNKEECLATWTNAWNNHVKVNFNLTKEDFCQKNYSLVPAREVLIEAQKRSEEKIFNKKTEGRLAEIRGSGVSTGEYWEAYLFPLLEQRDQLYREIVIKSVK